MEKLETVIKNNLELIKALREKLHDNAELSFKEYKTQEIIMEFLNSIEIKSSKITSTGVVALINNDDNCIALRADMDALPVNGVSHACGHDYHMAVVLGTAYILKKMDYKKCVKLIFQPNEEASGGALPMINDGVLESPKVREILSLHVWPGLKTGNIEITSGASMASVDDFYIYFKGISGHAALPGNCLNPLIPATELIHYMNIDSHFAKEPSCEKLLSFSCLHCGTVPNIIAKEAVLSGTVRTFDNNIRYKIHDELVEASDSIAKKYGCSSEVKYDFQFPPLINDKSMTEKFIEVSKLVLNNENILPLKKSFTAEDFAFFAEKIPSAHFRLGIEGNGKGSSPLHSSTFNADDNCLYYGILLMVNYILNSKRCDNER